MARPAVLHKNRARAVANRVGGQRRRGKDAGQWRHWPMEVLVAVGSPAMAKQNMGYVVVSGGGGDAVEEKRVGKEL